MKAKRLLALALALVMVFSLAIPVFAAMPNADASPESGSICTSCGADQGYYYWNDYEKFPVGRCSYHSTGHDHYHYVNYYSDCPNHCRSEAIGSGTICPFNPDVVMSVDNESVS